MGSSWSEELEASLDAELRTGAPDHPFRPAVLRWAAEAGRPADPEAVLASLEDAQVGGRGVRRFRWRLPSGSWIPLERRVHWRPAEAEQAQRGAQEHAARLWLPPVLVEHLEWLSELASGPDRGLAARARALLADVAPTVEDVVAERVGGLDAWGETFLLWSFVRRPQALSFVRGLVVALAARYALRAERSGGLVVGRRHPFYEQRLTSATAHLAAAAARLGEGSERLGGMLEYLREEQRPDDGWGDPQQPSDILTTLAAAEALGSLDPAFDLGPVAARLEGLASSCGPRPALLGPEWPWLATELLRFRTWSARPFPERFAWPHWPTWVIDERVGIPRFEAYLSLARLFDGVPALADEPLSIAFIDLANFGRWNSVHGQAEGDLLLARLARELTAVPDSRVIRDGGDEFLLVGRPRAEGIEASLREMFARWPVVSREAFPGLSVVPLRAVIGRERAGDLRAARERQGVRIGELKRERPEPPPEGVIVTYD